MELDPEVVGELPEVDAGGGCAAERRLHGRRAVHELGGRREQLDRDAREPASSRRASTHSSAATPAPATSTRVIGPPGIEGRFRVAG